MLARLLLLLGLGQSPAEPIRSWRDPRPVLVGAPRVIGAPLSCGEAP